jgi:hypothetical protein
VANVKGTPVIRTYMEPRFFINTAHIDKDARNVKQDGDTAKDRKPIMPSVRRGR